MDEQGKQHARRIRYKGANPRAFSEKYKELQPDKYADTIARVLQRGSTPAGTHRPICVTEIMEILQITPGQTGLDATLGYGGHAREMLRRLSPGGHLYAMDVDSVELPRTQARLVALGFGPEMFTALRLNFSDIDQVATLAGPLHFVLADLGVSSMQVDNPDRGFSYKADGPLDLRLDPAGGLTAAARLKSISPIELEGLLAENADEPNAAAIARAITVQIRQGTGIATTKQLRQAIAGALAFIPESRRADEIKKTCQRCFQALRIDINQELDALYTFLNKLPDVLAPGGRAAILTFHSGEDRLVKKSFQYYFRQGIYRETAPDPVRPSMEECAANSRARSAKLRWAIRA